MAERGKPKSGSRARVPRTRKAREKLDPRLDWLLSLPDTERESLVREDGEQILAAQRELTTALETDDGEEEADPEELRKRLARVEERVFAPLTTGIHRPDLDKRLRTRKPYASVFIRSQASSQDLRRLGARVRTRSCSIVTAFVALDSIGRLERSAAVEAIELARPILPTLDQTLPYAGVDVLQAGPPARTGAGVLVGVFDSALDVYHPDFRTAAGQSRVIFLWDQTLTPQGGESGPPVAPALPGFTPAGGATYGVEYTQANINAELGQPAGTAPYQLVRHGGTVAEHGTHVAGIAAGNGLAGNVPPRVGAAPGAGIIFVASAGTPGASLYADSASLADGVSYIFARASALGQPCVANVSSSDNQGPHDGTTLGEAFLDGLLTVPGRALTVAAGNSTTTACHASGTIAQAATSNVVLNYQPPTANQPHFSDDVEIWYDGHDRLSVTVTTPNGTVIGPLAAGAGALNQALPGGVQVTVTSTVSDPRNGDNVISMLITVPVGQALTGNWTIALTGTSVINGRFEAWVDRNNRGLSAFQAPFLDESRLTLGVPSSCRRAITVGSHYRTAPPPPAIRETSGLGPTRDGRIKPDIATVGVAVNAARSRNMASANPGAFYTSKGGTSMAAPLVAGTLALLFQCRGPALTWFDLLQVIQDDASATMPAGVPATPNNVFGYGWMQAANLCAGPVGSVDVWLRDNAADIGSEPSGAAVYWACPDIEVLDAAGNPVPNPQFHPTNRFNNRIRVTVRNRGTQIARNVEVYLYWADPGTNIPFPGEWRSTGIYAGPAPAFADQTNRITIPQIAAANGSQTVEFAWAPPAPGANVAGDDHFCLLVRLEHPADPSQAATGGFTVIPARNNLGLRNVHVQPNATGGDSETAFSVTGTDDADALVVLSELAGGRVRIDLPVGALPWRDARRHGRHPRPRAPYGCGEGDDPVERLKANLKGEEIAERTDIVGARTLELRDGIASITLADDRLLVPCLRLADGAKMPVRVRVNDIRTKGDQRFVHVAQLSGGRRVGGVALELRKGLRHPKKGAPRRDRRLGAQG